MDTLSGKYKIESTLGQGAMGKVYLVKDLRNGCYFAAKQCCSQNPKILERIRREFYFLTRINHPNIVRGIEFLQEKNSYFIVMDYIQGVTIRDVLKKNLFHVDFNKKLEIAIQICSAVAILNKAEIIHRDIKPSNIMLEGNNLVPRLLDLGIAKMESMQSLTQPGKVVGTPKYMSPEQVDGSVADNSDVFSLGVVLYQWFAWMENSPFHDQSKARVFRNILQARLPFLHEFLGEESPHIKYMAKLLDKALQKDPKKRIPSTEEMYKLLRGCPLARPLAPPPTQAADPISFSQTPSAYTSPVPIDLESTEETHKLAKRNTRKANNDDKILDKHVIIIPLLLATLISCGFFWLMSLDRPLQPLPQKKPQKIFVKNNPPIQETKKTIALKKTNKYVDKSTKNEKTTEQTTTLKTKEKIFAAHYKLGSQYMRLKNYEKALRHFTKAMKINRNHANLFKSRGFCFFYLAKYRRAIRDFRKALELQPNLQDDIQPYMIRAKRLQTDKRQFNMKIKIFFFCLLVVFSYADQQNNDKKALVFTLKKQEIPQGYELVQFSEKEKEQGLKNPGYVPQKTIENFCATTKIDSKNIISIYSLSLQGKTEQAGYIVFQFKDKKLLEAHVEKVLKIVIGWVFIYTHNEHLILFWSHDNESVPMLQKWSSRVVKRLKNDDKVALFFRGKKYIPPVF